MLGMQRLNMTGIEPTYEIERLEEVVELQFLDKTNHE